jgi:hypothetical protein
MDTDAASLLMFLVPGVLLPLVLLIRAFRSPSTRQVQRWAASCHVVITATNEHLVRSSLGRVRRFRSVAAFPFWWLATVPAVTGRMPLGTATPAVGLFAYLAGASIAVLTEKVDRAGPLKHASLSPRSLRDYLPAWLRITPWVLLLLSLLLLLIPVSAVSADAVAPSRTGDAVRLVLGTALVVLAELAARRVARRPQRSGDTDVLAADDGLRATAMAMTAGIAVLAAVASFNSAVQTLADATGSSPWFMVSMLVTLPGSLLMIGVLTAIVRQETWGFRHRHRQPAPAGLA